MASIYVSDVMDQVAATLEISGWDAQTGPPEVQVRETFVWPGVGELDARRWAERALIQVAEGMSRARLEGMRRARPMGVPNTISESSDNAQDMVG